MGSGFDSLWLHQFIGVWYNGITFGSDPTNKGSIPSAPAKFMEKEFDDSVCIVCGGQEPCSHDFDKMDKQLKTMFGKLKEFQPHVTVDVENKAINILLEDVSYYADWINSEGADFALYRANDGNRVVGARLPLRKWNGKLPVEILTSLV